MLKREDLQPLSECSGKYGAPMGRHGGTGDADYTGLVYLEPILDPCPNACGAYDYGGAYWGSGGMVWRAIPAEGDLDSTFFRASGGASRIEEKARAESGFESARFEVLPAPLGGCNAEEGDPCAYCLECDAEEESDT